MNRKRKGLATAIALGTISLCAIPAICQQKAAATPTATTRTHAIIRYGPEFFKGKGVQTAYDMVNLLPGFAFSLGVTNVRGYAEAAGNVLIDGERPSDKQFTLDVVLQQIPADQVDYIEVIEGGKTGIDMLGQPVVANVVRKKAAGNKTVVTLSNAIFDDGRNIPGGSVELTRHFRNGKALTSAISASKYVELAEGDGPDVETDSTNNVTGRTAVTSAAGGLNAYGYSTFVTPAWRGTFSLNGSSSRTDYNYSETDATTYPGRALSRLTEHLGGPLGGQLQNELGMHFSRSLGEKWTSENVALFDYMGQKYSSSLLAPGADEKFLEQEHTGETLVRSNFRFTANKAITAELSAEGAYNWLGTSSSYSYNVIAIPLPNANAGVSELRDQFRGNLIGSKSRKVEFELGMQVEDSRIESQADVNRSQALTYFKPRFVLSLTPDTVDRWRMRVEREVGQLDFTDFVASSSLDTGSVRSGNTNIVPQQDWVFEAIYERHFWSDSDLAFTYRHYMVADVLDRVAVAAPSNPAGLFDAAGNIGNGTEDTASADLTVSLDRLGIRNGQIKATGTRQWSRAKDPTTGAERPISALDPLEYSVGAYQNLPRLHTSWGASLRTPCAKSSTIKGCTETVYRFDEIDAYRATPAVNLYVETHASKGWLLHLEGDNVLRQRFTRVISTYAGPRNEYPLIKIDSRHLDSFSSLLFSIRKEF
ncbi:MAG TPA: hypothetical protein VHQ22_23195 [Terriglobales bacterium]|nr:hypothetical protein [Terriglobales bacterium]